jgi:2-polyprenyl-6-methoxyphenol hydroxylase-like FAD-dependent oxidoreductase
MSFDGHPTATPEPDPSPRGKRVAIVGAGLGGLSAAIALHQAGFDVKVFERHGKVAGIGGAILLNALGIHILRNYGASTDEIAVAPIARFQSRTGTPRVLWRTDQELLAKSGSQGWIAGLMRSDVYERMLAVVPDGMIVTGHRLARYDDTGGEVVLHFENGAEYRADLLIGADGFDSVVREQMFGPSLVEDLHITAWLSWCKAEGRISRDEMVLSHSEFYQLSYAPLRYRGEDCFEWWFLEPTVPGQQPPADPIAYIKEKAAAFVSPLPEIVAATDPDHHMIRWEIKNRPVLKKWSKGRVTLLGDACHPTSPYAGYGAGMAIEDGYFLGLDLAGANLSDLTQLTERLATYERQRLRYANRVVSFAKLLGKVFHHLPKPARRLRDFALDHGLLDRLIGNGYTKDAQDLFKLFLEAEDQKQG